MTSWGRSCVAPSMTLEATRTARRVPASGARGVLVQPADGAAGLRDHDRPRRHTRTGCRPAPAAGTVPALAGQPRISPGPAGHLPRRLASRRRAPHGNGGIARQPGTGAGDGVGTGHNRCSRPLRGYCRIHEGTALQQRNGRCGERQCDGPSTTLVDEADGCPQAPTNVMSFKASCRRASSRRCSLGRC